MSEGHKSLLGKDIGRRRSQLKQLRTLPALPGGEGRGDLQEAHEGDTIEMASSDVGPILEVPGPQWPHLRNGDNSTLCPGGSGPGQLSP